MILFIPHYLQTGWEMYLHFENTVKEENIFVHISQLVIL